MPGTTAQHTTFPWAYTFSVKLHEDIISLKVPDHPLDPSPSRGTLRCIISQIQISAIRYLQYSVFCQVPFSLTGKGSAGSTCAYCGQKQNGHLNKVFKLLLFSPSVLEWTLKTIFINAITLIVLENTFVFTDIIFNDGFNDLVNHKKKASSENAVLFQ